MSEIKPHWDVSVDFVKSGRGKARCASNPDFPDGVELNAADQNKPLCKIPLPYPAPECGTWMVVCGSCGLSVAITAAGRPDDPTSVTVNCLPLAKGTIQ